MTFALKRRFVKRVGPYKYMRQVDSHAEEGASHDKLYCTQQQTAD